MSNETVGPLSAVRSTIVCHSIRHRDSMVCSSSRSRSGRGEEPGTASARLPLALGRRQFSLDHRDKRAAGLIECVRQFEDCGERGLLLTQFEDAHVGATQVGLKAKPFLRQTGLQAQLAKNFPEGNRWLQISLLLLEELSRKLMIVSSHSYRNTIWVDHLVNGVNGNEF